MSPSREVIASVEEGSESMPVRPNSIISSFDRTRPLQVEADFGR